MKTSSISLNNQTELTGTTSTSTSKNAYSRFFCNPSLLVANFFYILPDQRPKTTTSSTKYASVPTVSGDNPVNASDPSGTSVVSGSMWGQDCSPGSEALNFYWFHFQGGEFGDKYSINKYDVSCILQAYGWEPRSISSTISTFDWTKEVELVPFKAGTVLLRYGNKNYTCGSFYTTQVFSSAKEVRQTIGLKEKWNSGKYVYAVMLTKDQLGIVGYEGAYGNGNGQQIILGDYGTSTKVYSEGTSNNSRKLIQSLVKKGLFPPKAFYSSISWSNIWDLVDG